VNATLLVVHKTETALSQSIVTVHKKK